MEPEKEQQWVSYGNINIGYTIRPEIGSCALGNTYASRTRLS